mgnify:CR=1 FL=1
MHLYIIIAILGVVIVCGLVLFSIQKIRNKRETGVRLAKKNRYYRFIQKTFLWNLPD